MPVIILDIGEEHRDKTGNAIQEVKARDARILHLCDKPEDSFVNSIRMVLSVDY